MWPSEKQSDLGGNCYPHNVHGNNCRKRTTNLHDGRLLLCELSTMNSPIRPQNASHPKRHAARPLSVSFTQSPITARLIIPGTNQSVTSKTPSRSNARSSYPKHKVLLRSQASCRPCRKPRTMIVGMSAGQKDEVRSPAKSNVEYPSDASSQDPTS